MTLQYVKADTPLHRMHLLVKLVYIMLTLVLVMLSTSFRDTPPLLLWLILSLSLWRLGAITLRYMKVVLKVLAGVIIFIVVVQAFMYRGETPLLVIGHWRIWGGADLGVITYEGVLFGLLISLKIITAVVAIPVFVMTTSPSKLMETLVRLRAPVSFAFALVSGMRFTPLVLDTWRRIVDAQKLRAFDIEAMNIVKRAFKAYVPIATPLILILLRRAYDLQIAIESRGFGAPKQRTFLEDIRFKPLDALALIFFVLFFALAIALKLHHEAIWRLLAPLLSLSPIG
jgi:energy-coupling factor transport system permease protein